MRRTLTLLCLSLLALHVPAVTRAGRQDAFRLKGSPLLRGFVEASVEREPILAGATVVYRARLFRGTSELRYSVLQFPTLKALMDWDSLMRRTSAVWSPLAKNREGVRWAPLEIRAVPQERGAVRRADLHPETAVDAVIGSCAAGRINRAVVLVYGFQHGEMLRRNPARARPAMRKQTLTNRALCERVRRVAEELAARAKRFSPNQNHA